MWYDYDSLRVEAIRILLNSIPDLLRLIVRLSHICKEF